MILNSSAEKMCYTCSRVLSLDNFHKDRSHKDGLRTKCMECVFEYNHARKDRFSALARFNRKSRKQFFEDRKCDTCGTIFSPVSPIQIYCSVKCRGSSVNAKEYSKQRRRSYIEEGKCIICAKQIDGGGHKNKCSVCAEKSRIASRDFYRDQRVKVLLMYGGKCVCCGEAELNFLSLDHINNDGAAHRKLVRAGSQMNKYVLKNHPKDIQILCFNCNMAKGFFGICPHQRPKPKLVCEEA